MSFSFRGLTFLLLFTASVNAQSLPVPLQDILSQRREALTTLSATGTLPDTFLLTTKPTAPGKVLQMDLDVRFRSASPGGFILVIRGLPIEFCQGQPLDITGGAATPSTPGRIWYRWTDSYGKVMQQYAMYATVLLDSTNSLTVSIFGINVDYLSTNVSSSIFPHSKSGVVISLYVLVPQTFPEGSYPLSPDPSGQVILKYPISNGFFTDVPTSILNPIVIKEEPEYNRGDVNRDGAVNVMDLLELLKILSGEIQ